MSPSATTYANDQHAAQQLLQRRHRDADALSKELAESKYDLGYTRVEKTLEGFLVDGQMCLGITCALAFILAKYW